VVLLAGLISFSSLFSNFAFQNVYAQPRQTDCTNWASLPDKDCDGLADSWENARSYNGVTLASANWLKKDIYVELDYMDLHLPRAGVIDAVKASFASSPVINPSPSTNGIILHVDIGDRITPHDDSISFPTDFDALKNRWFGTPTQRSNPDIVDAKKDVYHYVIFAHYQTANPPSSGIAEQPGNDALVTLGYTGWGVDPATGHTVGSVEQQKGAFMHELGHNFGLRHGGNVDENCKPNYLSVMNYEFQFPNYDSDRPLDYSRRTQVKLDENALIEANGVSSSDPLGRDTVFGRSNQPSPPQVQVKPTGIPLNYDWWSDSDTTDPLLQSSVNNLGQSGCNSNILTTSLFGFKDWVWLTYWATGGGFGNGTVPSDSNATTSGAALISPQLEANVTGHNVTRTTCDPADPRCGTPCDPSDPLCINPSNQTTVTYPPEQTIDDVRQSRVSLVSSINQAIQQLPDTAFRNPILANVTKMSISNDLLRSSDSAAVLMASDRLEESIIKLLQFKGKISSHSGAGAGDDLITEPNAQRGLATLTENLIQALLLQR
jgi:hypothetical protein